MKTGLKLFLIAGICHSVAIAQTLTSIIPNNGQQSQSLAVTISGQNTHFAQGSGTTGTTSVRLAKGQAAINASSFAATSNTSLGANFNLPSTAVTGLWNVEVVTNLDGLLTLPSAFNINLGAPANLTATPLPGSEIILEWTDRSGTAQSFKIERKLGIAGTYQQIATVGGDTTLYFDPGLVPQTQYCYRVRAFDGNSNSAYSNESCATTMFGAFSRIAAVLQGVYSSTAAWGDYDNDGDLDLLLSGATAPDPAYTPATKLYRNVTGAGAEFFEEVTTSLPAVWSGATAWGDFDNDGDLDILLTGNTGSQNTFVPSATIYRNDHGLFNTVPVALRGVSRSAAAWGDYDNDGDLDILLSSLRRPNRARPGVQRTRVSQVSLARRQCAASVAAVGALVGRGDESILSVVVMQTKSSYLTINVIYGITICRI